MSFHPDRKKIIEYIEERHLSDGGFFFARVLPSQPRDTYFATLTLTLLNADFDKDAVLRFWDKEINANIFLRFSGIFWAIDSLRLLKKGRSVFEKQWKSYATSLIKDHHELAQFFYYPIAELRPDAFDSVMLNISLANEYLAELFSLVSLYRSLEQEFDEGKVALHVSGFQQKDGGFGRRNASDTGMTLNALRIFQVLRRDPPNKRKIRTYLQGQFLKFDYLESLFDVTEGLALLNDSPLPHKEAALDFISSCQRNNGGFSRAMATGIPTLENTYQAVSILRNYKIL